MAEKLDEEYEAYKEWKKNENRKLYMLFGAGLIGFLLVRALLITREMIPRWGYRLVTIGLFLVAFYFFLMYLYRWYARINYRDRVNPIQRFFMRFYRNKLATVGLFVGLTFIVMAIFAPEIAIYPRGYSAEWKEFTLLPPCLEHPFGTVTSGEDLFSLVVHGSRISLTLGLSVVVVRSVIGIALGAIAGYHGGKVDKFLNYINDVLMSFPFLLLILVIVGAMRANPHLTEIMNNIGNTIGIDAHLLMVFVALSLFGWPGTFRVVRGQVLSIREKDFVMAAKSLGASTRRIIFRHIVINTFAPVIVLMTIGIGGVILTEAGLSFLGFGASVVTPSWGRLLSEGNAFVTQPAYTYLVVFPGVAIFLTILAFTTMGDGVRDAIDPRMKL
jgi:peptide/nickel transport system permease protein/oligopeptide transport system permease protein